MKVKALCVDVVKVKVLCIVPTMIYWPNVIPTAQKLHLFVNKAAPVGYNTQSDSDVGS